MTLILLVSTFLFGGLALFLAHEHRKKFRFFQEFVQGSDQLASLHYAGSKPEGIQRGMYNIVLRADRPFTALVGFTLRVPIIGYEGFDYYGIVHSDAEGVAVLSTFLGTGAVDFQFFSNTNQNPVCASWKHDGDQQLTPTAVFPPHFYQKWLGFYG